MKFHIKEEKWVNSFPPYESTVYSIIRSSDGKTIKQFSDYLKTLKYLEGLEDRSWLVS